VGPYGGLCWAGGLVETGFDEDDVATENRGQRKHKGGQPMTADDARNCRQANWFESGQADAHTGTHRPKKLHRTNARKWGYTMDSQAWRV
jgi:hypothetical protein